MSLPKNQKGKRGPPKGYGKGKPGTPGAGRPKGSPNKNTLAFREALEKRNFNLIEELIERYQAEKKMANDKKLKHDVRLGYAGLVDNKLRSFLKYSFPSFKSIEAKMGGMSELQMLMLMSPEEREALRQRLQKRKE